MYDDFESMCIDFGWLCELWKDAHQVFDEMLQRDFSIVSCKFSSQMNSNQVQEQLKGLWSVY